MIPRAMTKLTTMTKIMFQVTRRFLSSSLLGGKGGDMQKFALRRPRICTSTRVHNLRHNLGLNYRIDPPPGSLPSASFSPHLLFPSDTVCGIHGIHCTAARRLLLVVTTTFSLKQAPCRLYMRESACNGPRHFLDIMSGTNAIYTDWFTELCRGVTSWNLISESRSDKFLPAGCARECARTRHEFSDTRTRRWEILRWCWQ